MAKSIPDPVKSASWLSAYCLKWPAQNGPDTDVREHLKCLIPAFMALNGEAVKGEIHPGFWGSFAARCQRALKRVKEKAEGRIAELEKEKEARSQFSTEQSDCEANAGIEALKEVLEWIESE